ncbi:MAG TPA: biotin-dependent carboxyltransferase family protein [Candidatus Acidoferrales bacterium]|jgi:antagonist of KipI|nr:biotin-dependent carboxyltransferase family protein [Candidatus Acidoferrales bacterium]
MSGRGARTIHVEAPGLLTTVQDLGREGFGPMGVSPCGAADPLALRLGNRLVANPENAAALEMTLIGGTFVFPEGAIVALTGSDFGATLDGVAMEMWASIEVRPGQALRMGPTRAGARCYLCVQGGISVAPFLGSASTHLLIGLGGFGGRALRKGDVLEVGPGGSSFRKRRIAARALEQMSRREVLRFTAGPQADWFPAASRRAFREATYRVGEQSNRMGLRLEGPAVDQLPGKQMITEGVSLGAIQAPPEGAPIILFVDQQTTGGYPKIGNVIAADVHRVGQLRPRDEIRFEEVTLEAASSLLIEQERAIAAGEFFGERGAS